MLYSFGLLKLKICIKMFLLVSSLFYLHSILPLVVLAFNSKENIKTCFDYMYVWITEWRVFPF